MGLQVVALSDKHVRELELAVSRALSQWLPGDLPEPKTVVDALEKVLLFLRQNGSPTNQSRHVASLAFAWGQQLVRSGGFSWKSVSDDAGVNPSIVSADGARACMVVDAVTAMVMDAQPRSLGSLFRALQEGELPPDVHGCVRLESEKDLDA